MSLNHKTFHIFSVTLTHFYMNKARVVKPNCHFCTNCKKVAQKSQFSCHLHNVTFSLEICLIDYQHGLQYSVALIELFLTKPELIVSKKGVFIYFRLLLNLGSSMNDVNLILQYLNPLSFSVLTQLPFENFQGLLFVIPLPSSRVMSFMDGPLLYYCY